MGLIVNFKRSLATKHVKAPYFEVISTLIIVGLEIRLLLFYKPRNQRHGFSSLSLNLSDELLNVDSHQIYIYNWSGVPSWANKAVIRILNEWFCDVTFQG